MSFFSIIPTVDQLPSQFYETHHLLWKETNEPVVRGKQCSSMSSVAWWKIAEQTLIRFVPVEKTIVDLPKQFDHGNSVEVEFMCITRVTDTLKGIHFRLFLEIQTPDRDIRGLFKLLRRVENRIFELVQHRNYFNDAPDNYINAKYFPNDKFTGDFAFDMDAYLTSLNILEYRNWKLRDAERPEVNSVELRERVRSKIDSSTSRFVETKTKQAFFSLVGYEAYQRVYRRENTFVNNAGSEVTVIGIAPHFMDQIPKDVGGWKKPEFYKFAEHAMLAKMGNALTFEKHGRDPVKQLMESRVWFNQARAEYVLDETYVFTDLIDLYQFAHNLNPQDCPLLT